MSGNEALGCPSTWVSHHGEEVGSAAPEIEIKRHWTSESNLTWGLERSGAKPLGYSLQTAKAFYCWYTYNETEPVMDELDSRGKG